MCVRNIGTKTGPRGWRMVYTSATFRDVPAVTLPKWGWRHTSALHTKKEPSDWLVLIARAVCAALIAARLTRHVNYEHGVCRRPHICPFCNGYWPGEFSLRLHVAADHRFEPTTSRCHAPSVYNRVWVGGCLEVCVISSITSNRFTNDRRMALRNQTWNTLQASLFKLQTAT